jgi:hypothetical protein
MISLSLIFKRVHEVAMGKPLVGEGMLDESLVGNISQFITVSGLKKGN